MLRSFGKYILMLYYIFLKPEKFSVYWQRFIDEIIQLGVKSLFIVSIMSAFMGAVLVIQTATAIESGWIPDYTVGFIVKQSNAIRVLPNYYFINFSRKGWIKHSFRIRDYESNGTN